MLLARRVLVVVILLFGLWSPTVSAQSTCRFVLGFATLRDAVGPATIGDCLGNERHGANGDSLQRTTKGEMVWRKASNTMAFTDGHRTWAMGPNGVQRRLNTERFPWEPSETVAAPSPARSAAPPPAPPPARVSSPSARCGELASSLTSDAPRSTVEQLTAIWGPDDVTAAAEDQCREAAAKDGARGVECFQTAFAAARGRERLFPGQGFSAYQGAYDRCIAGR